MREQDVDGWSALHYAARTGLLSRIEWSIFEAQINRIPVNLQTSVVSPGTFARCLASSLMMCVCLHLYAALLYRTNGLTMLHIAVWNSKAPSVAVLLGEWPDRPNPWRSRVRLNQLLQVRGHSELDLAIMRGQLDSSRLVIRGGGYAKVFAGAGCDKLLHKLVLIGDAIAVELLLRNPFNHALVTKVRCGASGAWLCARSHAMSLWWPALDPHGAQHEVPCDVHLHLCSVPQPHRPAHLRVCGVQPARVLVVCQPVPRRAPVEAHAAARAQAAVHWRSGVLLCVP